MRLCLLDQRPTQPDQIDGRDCAQGEREDLLKKRVTLVRKQAQCKQHQLAGGNDQHGRQQRCGPACSAALQRSQSQPTGCNQHKVIEIGIRENC